MQNALTKIARFVSSALFVCPLLLIPAIHFTADPVFHLSAGLASFPLYGVGMACRTLGRRRKAGQVAAMLAGILLAAAIAGLVTGRIGAVFFCLCGALFFSLSGRMELRAFVPPYWLIGLGAYVLGPALLVLSFDAAAGSGSVPFSTSLATLRMLYVGPGLAYFVAGVFVINAESVRRGMRPASETNIRARIPSALLRANVILVSSLLLGSALLSNFGAVRNTISRFAQAVARAVAAFFLFLSQFASGSETGGTAPAGNSASGLPAAEASTSVWGDILFYAVTVLVFLLLGYGLVRLLIVLIRRLVQRWPIFWARIFGRLFRSDAAEYVDVVETLWNFGRARSILSDRVREIIDKIRPPARWEDMPDNRLKVRFAFQNFLRRHRSVFRSSLTADDWRLGGADDETRLFLEIYNQARYGSSPITDEMAALAKNMDEKRWNVSL